jgi:hypothetical protein
VIRSRSGIGIEAAGSSQGLHISRDVVAHVVIEEAADRQAGAEELRQVFLDVESGGSLAGDLAAVLLASGQVAPKRLVVDRDDEDDLLVDRGPGPRIGPRLRRDGRLEVGLDRREDLDRLLGGGAIEVVDRDHQTLRLQRLQQVGELAGEAVGVGEAPTGHRHRVDRDRLRERRADRRHDRRGEGKKELFSEGACQQCVEGTKERRDQRDGAEDGTDEHHA